MSKHSDKLDDISEALKKGSEKHKTQSEQLLGASKLHKTQSEELEDLADDLRDNQMAHGGITKGKSHAEGGIPMVVKSTGQKVELEGGEGVINKKNMADTKLHDFEGKKMTKCEIASEINSDGGNGVKIDCGGVTGRKYKHEDGGQVSEMEYHGVGNMFPDLTKEQRSQIMEAYMGKFEHGGNISDEINEHKALKRQKRNIKKMKRGGKVNPNPTPMMIVLKTNIYANAYEEDGEYFATMNLKNGEIYSVLFDSINKYTGDVKLVIDGREFSINKKDFTPITFDNKNIDKGLINISNSELSNTDIERLEVLMRLDPTKMTTDQIQFISEFKGNNNANYLTPTTIKYLYGLMFEHKSSSTRIGKIAIINNGVGNICGQAPKYVHCSINAKNKLQKLTEKTAINFHEIEKSINDIQNYSSDDENWGYFEDAFTLQADAVFLTYPYVNPKVDELASIMESHCSPYAVGISIADFTSMKELRQFGKKIKRYVTQNKDIFSVVMQPVEQGINKGSKSLITILKYMY